MSQTSAPDIHDDSEPRYCGTSGISPNEVCWSNCDAKAECGKNAKVPGQKCPLNVCCGK